MFKIDNQIIASRVHYPDTLKKGMNYYKKNRMIKIEFNGEQNAFYGTIQGSKNYDMKVSFNQEGDIVFADCTCPAHYALGGDCKHLVAFLMSLRDNVSNNMQQQQRLNKIRNKFRVENFLKSMDELENRDKEGKQEATLQIIMYGEYMRHTHQYEIIMNVKIGMGNKFYFLRNIRKFFESLDENGLVELGKNFTFHKESHHLSEKHTKLMDFLRECYELDERMSYYGSKNSKSLLSGKNIYLTDIQFKRVMEVMAGEDFIINLDGKEMNNKNLIQGKMPIEFDLFKKEDSFSLNVHYLDFKFITRDGEYMYSNGSIYHIPYAYREDLKLVKKIIQEGLVLDFEAPYAERLVSEVLPRIRHIARVNIEESLNETLIEEPLRAEIYFDKYKKGISADIVFNYGDEKIYPLRKNNYNSKDKLIVRDVKNESRVLELFEEPDFNVVEEKAVLTDENRLYEFVYEKISALHQITEIYYSDDFKTIVHQVKINCSAGVRISKENLLEFSFEMDGIDPKEVKDILLALKNRKKYHRLKNGAFLSLDDQEFLDIMDLMQELNMDESDFVGNVARLPKYRAFSINDRIIEGNMNIKRHLDFKHMIQNIMEPEDLDYSLPEGYEGILRPYQQKGYEWFRALDGYNFGGILADDMGLGKTLQTIVFIKSQYEKHHKPSLIIVPTSLMYNWEEEIQKFAASMEIKLIIGNKKERNEKLKDIQKCQIVLTSYPLIRRDIEEYKKIDFAYCILDEAQNIKNFNSLTSKAVKKIKAHGYFALTGTPIENNLSELWSIFDFIMPGFLLSHKKFVEKYEKPIIVNKDIQALESLIRQIRPFIIRRLKKDVLKELPDKTETKMICHMTHEQKKVYLAYLAKAKKEIMDEIEDKGYERSQIKILSLLTRLRQICCHPAMFLDDYEGESGKLEILMELVRESIASQHRILLFSQYTSMLDIIKKEFNKEGIDYSYLDGSTKAIDRKRLVRDFNEGLHSVFLISLKAGGTGLNLTGADTVIHYDPWWNPAVEDQATDRAYRIGQENKVQVYKLITYGTIEEKIYNMQKRKKNIIDSVIKPEETMLNKMNIEDIKELLSSE